ncbi:rRNA-binding ribosome biosynthesis protein rpf2 [Rhodotorula kratochvilovae]
MSTPLVAPAKPKNARSKRALDARAPQLVEKQAKTAIIARTTGISEKVKVALSELNQLKKPNSIAFSKANEVRPFEDPASLNFWSSKNDASLFLIGTHTKKRPHGLVWARCFAGEVMEMLEVGIEEVMAMSNFKGIKSTAGSVPLFHFTAAEPYANLWDSHPTFQQFKSILLDFFRGNELDGVSLKGLERVISVTIGDRPQSAEGVEGALAGGAAAAGKGKAVESLIGSFNPSAATQNYDEDKALPLVHFRTYTVHFMRSGLPQPRVELAPHGPHFSFSMRRSQTPAAEVWKQAMKKKEKKSTNGPKKSKNLDIDEMGNKVGQLHVDRQDLGKLQARKFKGLKKGPKRRAGDEEGAEAGEGAEAQEDGAKRRKEE